MRRFNVLIVEDNAIARAAVQSWLRTEDDIARTDEAATAAAALERLRSDTWHLLLLDLALPDGSGLDLLRRIRVIWPSLRVLIVSGLPEQAYARHALRCGAAGYWEKGQSEASFLQAVRQVLAGHRFVSATLAEILAQHVFQPNDQPPHLRLSVREFQVFYKFAQGRSTSQVADQLCLSTKTVSAYRKEVAQKMGLKANADFTRYALRNGLLG